MFELLAFKPEVAKAIRVYIALAPVTYVGGVSNPQKIFGAIPKPVLKAALYTNVEYQQESPFNRIFADIGCRAFPGLICKNALDIFVGFSEGQLNSSVSSLSLRFLEIF